MEEQRHCLVAPEGGGGAGPEGPGRSGGGRRRGNEPGLGVADEVAADMRASIGMGAKRERKETKPTVALPSLRQSAALSPDEETARLGKRGGGVHPCAAAGRWRR